VLQMYIDENTAKALRIKRAKLNLTKKQIANFLKINEATYRRLELGDVTTQKKIADKVVRWLLSNYE